MFFISLHVICVWFIYNAMTSCWTVITSENKLTLVQYYLIIVILFSYLHILGILTLWVSISFPSPYYCSAFDRRQKSPRKKVFWWIYWIELKKTWLNEFEILTTTLKLFWKQYKFYLKTMSRNPCINKEDKSRSS